MKKLCLFLIFIMLFQTVTVYAETLPSSARQEIVVPGNGDLSIVDEDFSVDTYYQSTAFNPSEEELKLIRAKEEAAEKIYDNYLTNIANESNAMDPSEQLSLYSSSSCVLNLTQYPQNKSYYCGNGTARSILMYEGINCSQATLASSNFLKTDTYGNTPWYITNGNDASQFPMAMTLRNISGFYYVPHPYGAAGANPITTSDLKQKIIATISDNHGVAISGCSAASSSAASHMPGYTTSSNVDHWVACRGFKNGGNTICIVDPVANSVVSWGSNVEPKYDITVAKAAAFAASKGIIW